MQHADLVAGLEPYRDDGDEDVAHLHPVLVFRLAGAFWSSQLMRDHVRIESGADVRLTDLAIGRYVRPGRADVQVGRHTNGIRKARLEPEPSRSVPGLFR